MTHQGHTVKPRQSHSQDRVSSWCDSRGAQVLGLQGSQPWGQRGDAQPSFLECGGVHRPQVAIAAGSKEAVG